MGIQKQEHIDYLIIDELAEKVANEPMEDGLIDEEDEKIIPQHILDEAKVDEAILEMHDRRQIEMFNDEVLNWSGHR